MPLWFWIGLGLLLLVVALFGFLWMAGWVCEELEYQTGEAERPFVNRP